MILALAVLLLQPQVQPQPKIQVSQLDASASVSSSAVAGRSDAAAGSPASANAEANSSSAAPSPATPAVTPAEFPAPTPAASPEPYPAAPIVLSPVPDSATESSSGYLSAPPLMAGSIHRWKAVVSNVIDPQFESRRDHWMWMSLSIAQHSAAGFDAWTTRREISSGQGQEMNPLLKPFAGNDSLYVVTQITPVAFDYLAHHMMYSSHKWERRIWWVPQALGAASSFAAGGHNLTVRANPAQ
jgi:hypothetical protein